MKNWWDMQGQPNVASDKKTVDSAELEGGKKALLWTAVVPAIMAVCYLLLIGIFAAMGGYKQVHIDH